MARYITLGHEGLVLGFIERIKHPPQSYAPARIFARPGLRGESQYVAHLSTAASARRWGIRPGRCDVSGHFHLIGGEKEALAMLKAHLKVR